MGSDSTKQLKIDLLANKAHITVLRALLRHLGGQIGLSESDFDRNYLRLLDEQIDKMIATDPIYDNDWKELIKTWLEGDVPGIDL